MFVFKAHRLFYHSTLGVRVIKKKKKVRVSTATSGRGGALFMGEVPPYDTATPQALGIRGEGPRLGGSGVNRDVWKNDIRRQTLK